MRKYFIIQKQYKCIIEINCRWDQEFFFSSLLVVVLNWGGFSEHHQWNLLYLNDLVHVCLDSHQSFVQPKTHGSGRGFMPFLIVDARIFSQLPVRHVYGSVGEEKSLISSPLGRLDVAKPTEPFSETSSVNQKLILSTSNSSRFKSSHVGWSIEQ